MMAQCYDLVQHGKRRSGASVPARHGIRRQRPEEVARDLLEKHGMMGVPINPLRITCAEGINSPLCERKRSSCSEKIHDCS